jgi:predicted metal-dependent hydrolase
MKLFLDNNEFEITHHVSPKIKRISLIFETKTNITIKTPPKIKAHELREIFYNNKNWILNTIAKVPSKNKFDFLVGSTLPYLGEKYPIKFIDDEKYKNVKIIFEDNIFLIYHNNTIHIEYNDFYTGLVNFYKLRAKKVISPLFQKWEQITSLHPSKVGYRVAKRRWGSCSHINNISINYMLLQFSIDAIEYVVLHELCHIQEKNHSKKFWNLVSLHMPNYKQKEKILKNKMF